MREFPPLRAYDGGLPPKPPKPVLKFTLFSDIDPDQKKDFLVDSFLGAGEASCIFGAPGAAKSMLATDLACHVAAGRNWFGRRVKQGGVLYVAAERAKLTERRLIAFRRYHNVTDLPLAVISGAIDLRSSPDHADVVANYALDLREISGRDVVLIIVDTISRVLAGGDENSPKDMGMLVTNISRLQEMTGAHITTLHHIPQDGNVRLRGHGALLGALDTTIAVEKAGAHRTATVLKDNDGTEDQRLAFDLHGVVLSIDDDGRETSAPVVLAITGDVPKQPPKRSLSDRQRLALAALAEIVLDCGMPAPSELSLPANTKVVAIEKWREILFDRGLLDRDGKNPRADFKRVRESLAARFLIGEMQGLVWSAKS